MRIDLIDVHVPEQSCGWNVPSAVYETESPIFEDRRYSLAIADHDRARTYSVKIGDEELKVATHMFVNVLMFDEGMYFESAYGPTDLVLLSRGAQPDDVREEFRVSLYVVPSKIGWNNYRSMVDDLRRVCQALIFDVRGKSSGGTVRKAEAEKPWRTHEEELIALCATSRRLRPLLAEIRSAPRSSMCVSYEYGAVSRSRTPRAMVSFMKRGIDPLRDGGERKCMVGRVRESRDIPEHRLLKAFLRLLCVRVANCRRGIAQEIERLGAEKRFRTRVNHEGEQSLYELEDVPRIRRYRERDAEAASVQGWLGDELAADFWKGIGETVFSPDGTQFAENDYYLEAANIILAYLRDTSHWGGAFASRQMVKKSSRMYEQWVLAQLVAAFGRCGVRMTSWDEIMSRSMDRQFGFDIPYNTVFSAELAPGYEVRVRYEPWIVPKDEAHRHAEETLCHFGRKSSSWCPDIVVELCRTEGGRRAVYAIALDAKYSRRPSQEMRANIVKYAKIRTTEGRFGRRIARQVWLIYPGGEVRGKRFALDDEAMFFSAASGVSYRDSSTPVEPAEQVLGDIVAMPGEKCDETEADEIGIVPRRVFVDFAAGTLAYFRSLIA